ncbi:MAG: sensor histidine kinase [Opitutaceae bacterium]
MDRSPIVPGGAGGYRLFEIPSEIDLLEQEAEKIRAEMVDLPELKGTLQYDQYGYHGGYLPALDVLPDTPRWTVDVRYGKGALMQQLILVPAMDRRFDRSNSYGFPKRFRISKLFPDGRTETIQEWMKEDCPNPGRIPLVFDIDQDWSNGFRIEVFRGAIEGERELLALDEVYGVTNNNEITVARKVNVSSSFESLPYWHEDFLIDHKTSLGLPLGSPAESTNTAADLFLEFDSKATSQITIEFDLGQNRKLSGLLLYPTSNRTGNWIPGFGFPQRIEISAVAELPNGRRSAPKDVPQRQGGNVELNPGYNVLRLPLYGVPGRWIRVKFSDFPGSSSLRYFGMGEVMLLSRYRSCPVEAVRCLSGYELSESALQPLTDGQADGRTVMRHLEWIRQVETRDELSLALDQVEGQVDSLRARLHRFYWVFGSSSLALILLCVIALSLYQFFNRRESSRELRSQITTDLHDDIGSSLSAISLGLRRIRRSIPSTDTHADCNKLDAIIQRVQASFQDVLWFTNSATDSLGHLIAKLVQTAEQLVPVEKLLIDCPAGLLDEDRKLKVMVKRDLLLVFSEALNNAVKHSDASQIQIGFSWDKRYFTLSILDNGIGFDVAAVEKVQGARPQLGLQSFQRRAERLDAEYLLQSEPGEGTFVRLRVRF